MGSPLHVLVVDDELLIRWSVAETLSAAGCSVVQGAHAVMMKRIDMHDLEGVVRSAVGPRFPDGVWHNDCLSDH